MQFQQLHDLAMSASCRR